MNREQIRDGLSRIAAQAFEAQQSGERAYDMARRMEKALAEPFDSEEPEEPPVVEKALAEPFEPPVEEPEERGIDVVHSQRGCAVILPPSARASHRSMSGGSLGGVQLFQDGDPFIEHFRTESGGVVETVVVLHNGSPKGRGAIRIPHLEIETHDGRLICYRDNVEIEPGQPCVVSNYHADGLSRGRARTLLDFAGALAADGPSPGEAFTEKLTYELERQVHRHPDVGNYVMGWPADKSGASQGGDGIEPYWHLWRNCAAGRALALLEVQRVAQREFRVMTDESGAFTWDPEIAYNADGDNMPDDWRRDRNTEIGSWYSHDWQHGARAIRAAMWIDSLTNGRHAFTRWYLEMMANFQVACCLSTAADSKGVDDSNWWSLERTLEWAKRQGPNPKMGRAMVHRSRFLFYCAANHIGGVEVQRAADLMEALWRASSNDFGRAFEMEARKIPEVKAEMEKPGGGRAEGWEDSDKCAQSRELQLAVAMLRDSGRRPLVKIGDWLGANLGPFPHTQINYTRSGYFGGTNPYYELMTHGDTTSEEFGGPDTPPEERRKRLLEVAESRSVEAGGAQPLNSCRDVTIWRGTR